MLFAFIAVKLSCMDNAFEKSFAERVYLVTKQIPEGRVATYGQIARLIGEPRAARAVGNALHNNPYPVTTPCHRVVNGKGGLAKHFGFEGIERQKQLLTNENVLVSKDYRVDLKRWQWRR